jgi:O-antigen/teichoic acid export membrane protein
VIGILAKTGGYSPAISGGLILLTLALPATALYLCAVSLLIGQEKGATLGVLQAVETLVRTGLGVVCVLLGGSVLSVITTLVAIRWLVLLGYWRALQVPPDPDGWRFEPAFFRKILAQVPVFAGITLFVAITRFAAPLLLPWLLDDQAAGHFAAAYLFVDLAVLLPTALVANLMPRFSLLAKDSPGPLTRVAQEGVKLMALTMLPVAGWVTLMAGPLLALVFRNPEIFLPATPVLQIGIWLCVLMAVDQVLSTTLIACGRQRDDLRSVALGAIATLVMLLSAIAAFGVRGAAVGLVAGYTLQVAARFILLTRLLPDFKPLPAVWRPLVASTVMMGIVIWIPRPDWVLAAVTGPVVYLLVLAALGALRPVECEGLGLLLRSTSKT